MKFPLAKIRRARLDAFVHPRGDFFEFEVNGGGVVLYLLRGELAVRPVRAHFKETLRATPNEPLVLVADGTYRASATRWSVGFRGAV